MLWTIIMMRHRVTVVDSQADISASGSSVTGATNLVPQYPHSVCRLGVSSWCFGSLRRRSHARASVVTAHCHRQVAASVPSRRIISRPRASVTGAFPGGRPRPSPQSTQAAAA